VNANINKSEAKRMLSCLVMIESEQNIHKETAWVPINVIGNFGLARSLGSLMPETKMDRHSRTGPPFS
jgi:hypothetical protein